jgi:hypothetical protein
MRSDRLLVVKEKVETDQNPIIYQRWLFLADKVERDPDLLAIPLKNIERWMVAGRLGNPWALVEWKTIILAAKESDSGMAGLLELLRDDGERARQLKSCSPFPGVLTRDERDQFTCAWTH